MAIINKQDTDGTKGTLSVGEFGYDNYAAGGDQGRVYVGDGSNNIPLAKKSETDANTTSLNNHIGSGGTSHANATTSTAGFMSSTDKTKIDGVEAGANNYTLPSDVVHQADYATSTVGGTVKVGSRLTISSGVLDADDQSLGFDAGKSFNTSGYQKLSNGLIIQWITSSTSTFPITFPNACFGCVSQIRYTADVYGRYISAFTTSGVTWHRSDLNSFLIAIGY
jgi:hypothetical protein